MKFGGKSTGFSGKGQPGFGKKTMGFSSKVGKGKGKGFGKGVGSPAK